MQEPVQSQKRKKTTDISLCSQEQTKRIYENAEKLRGWLGQFSPHTLQGRALDVRLMRICGQGLQQKHSQHIFSSFSLWYNIAHCRPALFLNDMFFFKLMVNMLLFCFVLFTLLFFLCLLYFRYRDRGKNQIKCKYKCAFASQSGMEKPRVLKMWGIFTFHT